MNTNEKSSANNSAEVAPTVTHLEAPAKLSIHVSSWKGGMNDYPSNFTAGSVAEYAIRYKEDPEEAIARAEGFGHDLYYVFAEGSIISAHRQAPVERISLALGDLIEMDGHIFKLAEAANSNIKLIPVTAEEAKA